MNVSVALAAYNGEKYISEQIDSILVQLKSNDELVISINPSSDLTEYIVRKYTLKDSRVKLHICLELGVLANFENAIKLCQNEIIFLSDQDDIWCKDKVSLVLNAFSNQCVGAVVHDIQVVDENLDKIDVKVKRSYNGKITPFKILIQNRLQGSCLAFRKEYVKDILPFPKGIPMHDSWIGMIIAYYSNISYLDKKLIFYRRHPDTVTCLHKKQNIITMVKDRFSLLYNYLDHIW